MSHTPVSKNFAKFLIFDFFEKLGRKIYKSYMAQIVFVIPRLLKCRFPNMHDYSLRKCTFYASLF